MEKVTLEEALEWVGARLVVEIKAAYAVGRGGYGSPRVQGELRKKGRHVGKKRIERLMRCEGIQARRRRRFRATTDSKHAAPIPPPTSLLDNSPSRLRTRRGSPT